jgi:hypothetical protein
MDSKLLHVVTVRFNPKRWGVPPAHYRAFEQHMLDSGVNLTVVECALGERPFEADGTPGVNHIGVRSKSLVWNKENLINIGISRLPPTAKYIAWIDADVEFRNPHWASDTVHALQQYSVVQPWSEALDLGPDGTPMTIKGRQVHTSFAKIWRYEGQILPEPYMYAHPGYAWASRRDVLDNLGGLLEISGLGSADHQMAMAMIGQPENSIHGMTDKGYQDAILAWAVLADTYVKGNLGFVQGLVEHKFHGEKARRKYVERWDILIKHKFNPLTDLKRNTYGVMELAGNKPAMARDIDSYFGQRNEDANVIFAP